jgi:hypothetical protein
VPELQAGNGDYLGFRSFGDQTIFVWGYNAEVIVPRAAPGAELRE